MALEVAPKGRATADRDGAARLDPADERRESALGARHASTANCSSLGLRVAQSSVAKYMVQTAWAAKPGWWTFLHNHVPDIAAMDLFAVPTIGFDLLYAFVIVRIVVEDLVWINVTSISTADWVERQITEAFPWDEAPRYLIRDRDRIYGSVVTRRLRAMGIRDKPIAPAPPWQNGLSNG